MAGPRIRVLRGTALVLAGAALGWMAARTSGVRGSAPHTPPQVRTALGPVHGERIAASQAPGASGDVFDHFHGQTGVEPDDVPAAGPSSLKDPEMEARARTMVAFGAGEKERLEGLELLSEIETQSAQTRVLLLDLIRSAPTLALLRGALEALRPAVVGPAEAQAVMAAVRPMVAHQDAEVRRYAVIAVAEWAREAADLDAVVQALHDPSAEVRMSAAFALRHARVVPPLDALTARVLDDREDWDVREEAWRTLGSWPMDAYTYAVYAGFAGLRRSRGEDDVED